MEKIRSTVLSIGENKTHPRIWIEGRYLDKAGFAKGSKIQVMYSKNQITIMLDTEAEKIVSGKKSPVIDINNEKITECFNKDKSVKVVVYVGQIIITRTKLNNRIESRLNDRSCASVFSGIGLMDQAAHKAGYNSKWGIELNDKYADLWQANNKGIMFNSSIEEINYSELDPVELLIGGIPCEPFSIARQNKNKNELYEEHQHADLSMFFLLVVEHVNPRTIVLEEVPAYIKSGIGTATINALKRMGYHVNVKIISGLEHGELTIRKRAVIVATTESPYEFPEEQTTDRTMKEILLSPDDPRCEWFTPESKSWVFDHWQTQKAKGNNFQSQQITENTKQVQAITKRYFAQQAANPVVKHPTKENTFRWLTIDEVKKIMGLDPDFYLGESKTTAGEGMGQGVLVNVFKKIIDKVRALN